MKPGTELSRGALASLRPGWRAATTLLAEHRDVLEERATAGEAPASVTRRGWAPFLASLSDDDLSAIEILGNEAPWPTDTPASLVELVTRARTVVSLAPLEAERAAPRPARRRETPRKRAQIDAFAGLVAGVVAHAPRGTRIVDVGSGHGHLTRDLAREIGLPVLGLERNATIVGRARALVPAGAPFPAFAITDVLEDGLPLAPDDCVLGLHACGELGDAIVTAVAEHAASLVLVGCCLQKRRASVRRPLCDDGAVGGAMALPREILGLSNLAAGDDGVEATRTENLRARERRLALHRLVSAAVGPLRPGAEIEGLNRRAAHYDLERLVALAFAKRGLPLPSRAAIDDAALHAHAEHARARRFELPRAALARVLEVAVLLDRGLHLEERGFDVHVGPAFSPAVSPRNLALVATR